MVEVDKKIAKNAAIAAAAGAAGAGVGIARSRNWGPCITKIPVNLINPDEYV